MFPSANDALRCLKYAAKAACLSWWSEFLEDVRILHIGLSSLTHHHKSHRHNHAGKHTHARAVHTHLPHQWVNVKEPCYYSVSSHIKWTIPFNKHTWDLTAMHENCCLHWIFITEWNKLTCFPPLIIVILAARQRWVQRCKKESSNKTEVIEVWGKNYL